jgi:hypothetical protein
MSSGRKMIRTGATCLALALLLLLPAGIAGAADGEAPLAVDVWTDKGGQGLGAPGGIYELGEEPRVYFQVSAPCQVRLTATGEQGSRSDPPQVLETAGTYNLSLGPAEEIDLGGWQFTVEVWTTGQYASDTVAFSVVEAGAAAPPPATKARGDCDGDGETTAADAQCALGMAVGKIAEDPAADVSGDGRVSSLDARKILRAALGLEALA